MTIRADMTFNEEMVARRRMLRRIEVAEAREQGVAMFVAREDLADEDVVEGRTRVAHDHELLRAHPELFEPAAPRHRPLHEPLPPEYTDAIMKGRMNGRHAA